MIRLVSVTLINREPDTFDVNAPMVFTDEDILGAVPLRETVGEIRLQCLAIVKLFGGEPGQDVTITLAATFPGEESMTRIGNRQFKWPGTMGLSLFVPIDFTHKYDLRDPGAPDIEAYELPLRLLVDGVPAHETQFVFFRER